MKSTSIYKHNSINPYILEERRSNITSLDIFSKLLSNRIIFLGDEIDEEVGNIVQAELLYLDSLSTDPITMYINSPGGYVHSGLAIVDTMKLVKSEVKTICTGMAASMAAVILSSGTTRAILPNAKVMIHQPIGGAYGQASDVIIEANELEKTKLNLAHLLADNCKRELTEVLNDMDRDFWMDAKEAVTYRIVDKILS